MQDGERGGGAEIGEFDARAIDRSIGERLRQRRAELGLTQEQLGAAVGLSYQQIQKYERGANGLTVRKLVDLARALDTAPGHFLDQLAAAPAKAVHGGTLRPDIDLARSYGRLADGELRSSLAGLVRLLAERTPPDSGSDQKNDP
ncbi:MAG: XRE family transcriptional regulator [Geminicoccaceae bacterium]|nr:MAG: XRE family transcriptional regulator [Geminicoccaceae bacterium]